MSEYTYPQELIKQTQLRIQKQLEGNCLDVSEIPIAIKRQGIGKFTSQTLFTIDCTVETRQEKGKQSIGRVIAQGQLQTEIKNFTENYAQKESIESTGIELIKTLPLQGFGADKEILKLNDNPEILTEHQNCPQCSGQGQVKCNTCNATKIVKCNTCNGEGLIVCKFCGGVGDIPQGKRRIRCATCRIRGKQPCLRCNGNRQLACTVCRATGNKTCVGCQGTGIHSVITTITPTLKTKANFYLQDLETDPKNMINKIGALKLAKGGHININVTQQPIIEEIERAYFEEEEDTKIKNTVFYEATIVWALGKLTYKDKEHEITFVGAKGAIGKSGTFMDDALTPALNLLKNAAKGNGYVAGLLKDTCEYRVSRETLSYISQGNKKSAMAKLQKTYGIGLSNNIIKSFVINGFNALKRITRRPRYIGLVAGLLISSGINYSWFINNLRDNTSQYEPLIRYIIDSIPLIFGIIITITIIKHAGNFALKPIMKTIGAQNNNMPAVGTAGIYAFIVNIALWGILFSNLFLGFY